MDQAKKRETSNFLKKFKSIGTQGRGIDIVHRRKNLESLAKLHITKTNCKAEILGLSVENYCKGPEPDTDRPGEIWEFGKYISGKAIYIKLKIAEVKGVKIAKCISFHEAEFPLCFPFEGAGERRDES